MKDFDDIREYADAIVALRPNAKFHIREANLEGIDWVEELEEPLTEEELQNYIDSL